MNKLLSKSTIIVFYVLTAILFFGLIIGFAVSESNYITFATTTTNSAALLDNQMYNIVVNGSVNYSNLQTYYNFYNSLGASAIVAYSDSTRMFFDGGVLLSIRTATIAIDVIIGILWIAYAAFIIIMKKRTSTNASANTNTSQPTNQQGQDYQTSYAQQNVQSSEQPVEAQTLDSAIVSEPEVESENEVETEADIEEEKTAPAKKSSTAKKSTATKKSSTTKKASSTKSSSTAKKSTSTKSGSTAKKTSGTKKSTSSKK